MRMTGYCAATVAAVLLTGSVALAEPVACPGTTVSVDAARVADRDMVCRAALSAGDVFAGCGVPQLDRPIRIDVVANLPQNCLGQYHCGEDRIELLEPASMRLIRRTEGPLSGVPAPDFFASVVVHELTHASLETAPCPFDDCVVAHEYVASVMQTLSLSHAARDYLSEIAPEGQSVSRDDLSRIMLMMAPDRFVLNAWRHFTQRDDPCKFVEQIVTGQVVLDRERF